MSQEAIGALADGDADFPGSCGRCYDIRCVTGTVYGQCTLSCEASNLCHCNLVTTQRTGGSPILNCVDDPSKPVRIVNGTFNGDEGRPYLAAINPTYVDTLGR